MFLLFERGVVGEQIELLTAVLGCGDGAFVHHMIGREGQPTDQQRGIDNAVIQAEHGFDELPGRGGLPLEIDRAVSRLGHLPPIAVGRDRAVVRIAALGIGQTRNIVAHREHDLVGHHALVHQIKRGRVGHFVRDQSSLLKIIGLLQHLTIAEGMIFRLIRLDHVNGARFPAPRVVDQQLGVDAEELVQQILVRDRAQGDVPHRIDAVAGQFIGDPLPHPPEIGQRAVIPKRMPIAHFIQRGDSDAVRIRLDMLGDNIHRDLTQIEVAADACGGCDAGRLQHIPDHRHGQLPGGHVINVQIMRDIHEYLVDRVNMDVLGRNIFEINVVNLGAACNIMRHARHSNLISGRQLRVGVQFGAGRRFPDQLPSGRVLPPFRVDLLDPLHHFK